MFTEIGLAWERQRLGDPRRIAEQWLIDHIPEDLKIR